MTELEQQLTKALRELSAQYEREQKHQAERVETLRKQVQRLEGQVALLAKDYKNLAAALPAQWRR